jgi:hypothetical protein
MGIKAAPVAATLITTTAARTAVKEERKRRGWDASINAAYLLRDPAAIRGPARVKILSWILVGFSHGHSGNFLGLLGWFRATEPSSTVSA